MFGKITHLSKNRSLRRFFCFFLVGFLSFSMFAVFAGNDLLNQVFDEAKRYDTVINPGNSKDAVGGQVFNKTTQVTINLKNGGTLIQGESQEPVLIRLTKLILRISIVVAVPIIIRGGIMYATALGDANKQKKARNIVIYALVGIFLGLSSLAIIELVLTVTKKSIEF